MAHRVHAPGDMMAQKDAHQSSPQEPGPPTQQKRNEQGEGNPEHEGTINGHDQWIGAQVTTICGGGRIRIIEHPANMGMEKSFYRTMGITFLVCMGMMLDMDTGPLDGGTFYGHRSTDQ